MKKTHNTTKVLFTLITLAISQMTVIPQASAESSLLMQLNEKLNQEIGVFQNNASQLSQSSDHIQKAHQLFKKAESLPKGSNDFAYARSNYALEMAKVLENRMRIAKESLRASDFMVTTTDQLIQASMDESSSKGTIFKSTDSKKIIQDKIAQMKGLYAAFKSLNTQQNSKLNQAFEALNMTMTSNELNQKVKSTNNKNTFLELRDEAEGVYFTVQAYINSLDAEVNYMKMIAVGGGVQSVVDRARKIISNGIESFKMDGKEMAGMRYFADSISPQYVSYTATQTDIPDFENRLEALAATIGK